MNLVQAYNGIEIHYKKIINAGCTSTRRRNYDEIVSIMAKCKEVCKYYRLDTTQHFIEDRIIKVATLEVNYSVSSHELAKSLMPKETKKYCAYIVELVDCDMIKVGKANNFNSRMNGLEADYGKISPIYTFEFDNVEDAYLMEVVLHKYFKEQHPEAMFFPQDRFAYVPVSKSEIYTLEQSAKIIRNTKWF